MFKNLILFLLLCPQIVMADSKISAMTETTSPSVNDNIPVVINISTTPANRRSSIANIFKSGDITINGTNVGVGSTVPGQKLDVQGTVRATAFSGDGSALTGVSSISGLNAGYISKASSSTAIADSGLYESSGNFGIGTITPDALLSVTSTASQTLFRVNDNGDSDATPAIYVNQNGNVGIGTTTIGAVSTLTVVDQTNNPGNIRMYVPNSTATNSTAWFIGQTVDSTGTFGVFPSAYSVVPSRASRTVLLSQTGSTGVTLDADGGGDLRFASSGTERIRMLSGGNLGLGTTTPASKLTVVGNIGIGTNSNTAYITTSPPNGGMIIEGNVGIGTSIADTAYLTVGSRAISGSGTTTHINLGSDFSATPGQNLKLLIYDASGSDYGFGVSSGRMDYVVNATSDNHAFYGGSNLVALIKGDGNVGIGTSTVTGRFQVWPTTIQSISAGNTITANACGSVKLISSASPVTTSTTDTFTTPVTSQAGCCMRVVNVNAADAITLDNNSNFKSNGAADVVLGSYDTAEVCSDGVAWFQVGSTGNN